MSFKFSGLLVLCALAACAGSTPRAPTVTAAPHTIVHDGSYAGDMDNVTLGGAAGPLSEGEIRTKVIGKTIASHSHSGKSYTMLLTADGSGLNIFNGSTRESLTWDIKGNVLCLHGPMSGTECNKISTNAAGFDFVDALSGKLNNRYTLQ